MAQGAKEHSCYQADKHFRIISTGSPVPLPAATKAAAGLVAFSTTLGQHSFTEHTQPDLNPSPPRELLADNTLLHRLTGKRAEQLHPSEGPGRAVGPGWEKRHVSWLTGQLKPLPIAVPAPVTALCSPERGTGMSCWQPRCRQSHGSALKLATRTKT